MPPRKAGTAFATTPADGLPARSARIRSNAPRSTGHQALLATRTDKLPWLFVSERQAQLTRQAVNYVVRLAGEKAKLGRVWPHMLRHSCGYYLANQGLIFARCRTTLATAIPSTRPITPALPDTGLKESGVIPGRRHRGDAGWDPVRPLRTITFEMGFTRTMRKRPTSPAH